MFVTAVCVFFYAKMAKESLFTTLKYSYQIEYVVFVVGHG